jgi:hypothetical protein
VDLSSASDRLSCWLVERVFRVNPPVLSALIASRTRFITNDLDVKTPGIYKLRKFASMGSALTFPVQSLVFYTLCVAAGIEATGTPIREWAKVARQVRVYGDDLIVPVSWMPFVEVLFSALFLKINLSKTFRNGKFRESCGMDAWEGYEVSPGQVRQFYDESKLGTITSVVEQANNLYSKGFWHAAAKLVAPMADGVRKLIPTVQLGSGSFGLLSGSGFSTMARKRWNEELQFEEYASWVVKPKGSRTARHEGFANLLQYFTEDPTLSPLREWESGVFAKPTPVTRSGWVQVP